MFYYVLVDLNLVYYRCWETNPNISQWMRDNGLTEIHQVEEYYMSRVLTLTRELGYKSIVWQDVWDNNVKVSNIYRNILSKFFFYCCCFQLKI